MFIWAEILVLVSSVINLILAFKKNTALIIANIAILFTSCVLLIKAIKKLERGEEI